MISGSSEKCQYIPPKGQMDSFSRYQCGQTRPGLDLRFLNYLRPGRSAVYSNYIKQKRRRKPVYYQDDASPKENLKWQVKMTSFSLGGGLYEKYQKISTLFAQLSCIKFRASHPGQIVAISNSNILSLLSVKLTGKGFYFL